MAQPATRRRLSAADRRFLQACLGEDAAAKGDESQVYFYLAEGDDEADAAGFQESMCGYFADAAGESNKNRHYDHLDDIYSFDLDKVTQALQNGSTQQELSEAVEQAMVEALERRLAGPAPLVEWLESKGLGKYALRIAELSDAETPEDLKLLDSSMLEDLIADAGLKVVSAQKLRLAFKELCRESREAGCTASHVTGNVDGLMTPPTAPDSGRCTPQTTDGIPEATVSKDLVQRLSTLRCSSAMPRFLAEPCALHSDQKLRQLQEQANTVELISEKQASGAAAFRKSLLGTNGMRRPSLLKATNILECAGAAGTTEDFAQQLDKVQRAVEDASRRHRRSVSTAFEAVAAARQHDGSQQHAKLTEDDASTFHADDRVQRIVSSAYARHMYMMGE